MKAKKKKRLRRAMEIKGINSCLGSLLARIQLDGGIIGKGNALLSLEKKAGITPPERGASFSSKPWRNLRAIALLCPIYEFSLPALIGATKRQLLSTVSEGSELYLACEKYPLLDGVDLSPQPKRKEATPQKLKEPDRIDRFYRGYQWRKLRYMILQKYGRTCMACGRSDLIIHVDHIKPLRKYWELRLDPNNLQVLCEECNHGKGNWDETDWRPVDVEEIRVAIQQVRLAKAAQKS